MDSSAGRLGKAVAAPLALLFALAFVLAVHASTAHAATPVAISPLNGTHDASPYTQISFLGPAPSEIAGVSVRGSRTGSHGGHLRAYATAPGASFVVDHQFSQGEGVEASALVGPKGHQRRVSTYFTVAQLAPYPVEKVTPIELKGHGQEQSFQSQPRLKPPVVSVTANAGASPGDIFLTPTAGYGQSGPMILDPQGRLQWFHPVPKGTSAANLQVQSYRGAPVLTWWYGQVPPHLGVGFGRDVIMDTSYKQIATVGAGNGYQADLHDFQITPQGSAFLTAYSLVSTNLSSVGGHSDGILQDAILQEVDIPTGLVMFEWHAWGHVGLADSYGRKPYANLPWDFFHINSVSLDPWGDGDFIISSRNMWAAYEVDHVSGAVLWRLGGRKSSFKMGPGTGMAYQHDVRWQPDRTLTIFDNGAYPTVHKQSRVIRERIDFTHRKVILVSRYTGGITAGSQGNSEFLANGNVFVGWGEAPYMTEYGPTGQVLFSAHIPRPTQSYRAYRFPWQAAPASRPALAVKHGSGGTTVYASWNGATGVAAWQLFAGASTSSLTPVAAVPSRGFETPISFPGAPYVAVRALGADGAVLGTSPSSPG